MCDEKIKEKQRKNACKSTRSKQRSVREEKGEGRLSLRRGKNWGVRSDAMSVWQKRGRMPRRREKTNPVWRRSEGQKYKEKKKIPKRDIRNMYNILSIESHDWTRRRPERMGEHIDKFLELKL